MKQCEWCAKLAEWRLWPGTEPGRAPEGYERFSCADHMPWTKRLMVLDCGLPFTYQWEPAE